MSRREHTIEPGYFDALFRADPDPWRFRTSAYEQDKYRATLSALRRDAYPDVLEIGCANGAFTRLLAARCDRLLALDASPVALDLARDACAGLPNVSLVEASIPDGFPSGQYDLIVVSEVLYYLTSEDVEATARQCAENLLPRGDIILCHWLGETDYPLSGQDAADLFVSAAVDEGFAHACLIDAVYRLDRLSRASPT